MGLDEISRRVKKPLKGLKLAAYYGCYLVRPPEVTEFDDPENPMLMDNLLRACGAETVDYTHKVECCGGSLLLARVDIVQKLVNDICEAALDTGAVGIVTACPLDGKPRHPPAKDTRADFAFHGADRYSTRRGGEGLRGVA